MTKAFLVAAPASAFLLAAAPQLPQGQNPPEVSTQEEVTVF
jgi:hypothetical protein